MQRTLSPPTSSTPVPSTNAANELTVRCDGGEGEGEDEPSAGAFGSGVVGVVPAPEPAPEPAPAPPASSPALPLAPESVRLPGSGGGGDEGSEIAPALGLEVGERVVDGLATATARPPSDTTSCAACAPSEMMGRGGGTEGASLVSMGDGNLKSNCV